jgi:hypothetical protein
MYIKYIMKTYLRESFDELLPCDLSPDVADALLAQQIELHLYSTAHHINTRGQIYIYIYIHIKYNCQIELHLSSTQNTNTKG